MSYFVLFIWDGGVEGARAGEGAERSRLPLEQGAQWEAWSQAPGITTWAEADA